MKWTNKPVNREGMAQYLHLIRSPDDPKELSRPERKALGIEPTTWQRAMGSDTVDEWRMLFKELMKDGKARTFNHIMVAVSEGRWTADRAAGKAPDEALWELVRIGWLEHTLETPILFRRKHVSKAGKAKRRRDKTHKAQV